MKRYVGTICAGLILTGISFGVTACQQAPAPVSAAPADTPAPVAAAPAPVVVEERPQVVVERPVVREERPRVGVDVDVHRQPDRDRVSVDLHAH